MRKYEIISLDMFQMLVDVNQRVPEIWKGVLGDEYTQEKGVLGANAIMKNLSMAYKRSIKPFRNIK